MVKILCFVFVLLAGCSRLETQTPPVKYQMVADAKGRVWKMDTTTGYGWYCSADTMGPPKCFSVEDDVPSLGKL